MFTGVYDRCVPIKMSGLHWTNAATLPSEYITLTHSQILWWMTKCLFFWGSEILFGLWDKWNLQNASHKIAIKFTYRVYQDKCNYYSQCPFPERLKQHKSYIWQNILMNTWNIEWCSCCCLRCQARLPPKAGEKLSNKENYSSAVSCATPQLFFILMQLSQTD